MKIIDMPSRPPARSTLLSGFQCVVSKAANAMGWLNRLIWRSGDMARDARLGYRMGSNAAVAKRVGSIRDAAQRGDPNAQFALGTMLADGRGVPRDYGESAVWLRQAAEQGISEAAFKLSNMYAAAHIASTLADSTFSDVARKMRDELAAKMTAEQIAAAGRLADHMRKGRKSN